MAGEHSTFDEFMTSVRFSGNQKYVVGHSTKELSFGSVGLAARRGVSYSNFDCEGVRVPTAEFLREQSHVLQNYATGRHPRLLDTLAI